MLLFSPGHFGRGSKDKGNDAGDERIGDATIPQIWCRMQFHK